MPDVVHEVGPMKTLPLGVTRQETDHASSDALIRTPEPTPPEPDEPGQDEIDTVLEEEADLEAEIRAALCRGHFPLRAVEVTVAAGRIVLSGRVASYYLKQVAQEMAGTGGRPVRNGLVVDQPTRAAAEQLSYARPQPLSFARRVR